MKINRDDLHNSGFSYFLGKSVTLLTYSSSLPQDASEKGSFLYFKTFGGICEGFDEHGVWLVDQLDDNIKTKSFFFFSAIQGITENPSLDKDHPLVQEALKKMESKKQEPVFSDMSIDQLHNIMKEQK